MIETIHEYSVGDVAVIEKLVDTKDVSIAHAIIEPGSSFPKHTANADVKIILVRGTLSVIFNKQEKHVYVHSILEVPKGTEMELLNEGSDAVEFFAVKAPSPTYRK